MIQQKAKDRRKGMRGSQPWSLNVIFETDCLPISYCFLTKLEGYDK